MKNLKSLILLHEFLWHGDNKKQRRKNNEIKKETK